MGSEREGRLFWSGGGGRDRIYIDRWKMEKGITKFV